jgi:hypothetical protein
MKNIPISFVLLVAVIAFMVGLNWARHEVRLTTLESSTASHDSRLRTLETQTAKRLNTGAWCTKIAGVASKLLMWVSAGHVKALLK